MKRLVITLALAAAPTIASATGIDLTWKDCVGVGGVNSQAFTCTGTVNQTYHLVFQFKLPLNIPNFVGLEADADYQNAAGAPLTPFWHYEAGGCDNPAVGTKGVAMFDNIQLLPGCNSVPFADPWDGDGSGGFEGIAAYGVDFHRPGDGYFILGDARAAATPLSQQINYYAFHLDFNNKNRSTCTGCTDQGAIVFQRAHFESNDGSPAVDLSNPDKQGQCVTVNGGSVALCGIVPVRATTWGQLKSLYH